MLNVYEELGEVSRREILGELCRGPKCVSEIVQLTGLKQPNVSNHLARMRERGVVSATRLGRQMIYSLASPDVASIVDSVLRVDTGPTPDLKLEELGKLYAKSAVQGEESACNDILQATFRASLTMVDIYSEVLCPAMQLVGKWYEVEAIDEAQEHLASNITERIMARVSARNFQMTPHKGVVILGCAAGSRHTIGIRMVSDVLRQQGWKTMFLGADTPTPGFINSVIQHKPRLVLVGCTAAETQLGCLTLIESLKRVQKTLVFQIGVGGLAAARSPQLFLAAGADFVALDLRSFVSEDIPRLEKQVFADGNE